MFDINSAIYLFDVGRLDIHLDEIKNASKGELLEIKKEIINHGKTNKQRQAFNDVKNYSTHKAFVSAIKY